MYQIVFEPHEPVKKLSNARCKCSNIVRSSLNTVLNISPADFAGVSRRFGATRHRLSTLSSSGGAWHANCTTDVSRGYGMKTTFSLVAVLLSLTANAFAEQPWPIIWDDLAHKWISSAPRQVCDEEQCVSATPQWAWRGRTRVKLAPQWVPAGSRWMLATPMWLWDVAQGQWVAGFIATGEPQKSRQPTSRPSPNLDFCHQFRNLSDPFDMSELRCMFPEVESGSSHDRDNRVSTHDYGCESRCWQGYKCSLVAAVGDDTGCQLHRDRCLAQCH